MPFDFAVLRNRATTLAVVAGLLLMGLGVFAFVVALRPCRVELEPGRTLTWELATTLTELTADGKDGRMHESRHLLHLVCTGPGNQAALVVDGDGRDQVEPVVISPDGTTRRLDPQGRPAETGVAIGWFDLSLMPLPPDSGHRPWDITVPYAPLPPERAQVQARARRQRAGAAPEFQLRFPESVQWLDGQRRYRQLRDLACSYRFAGDRGVVDRAELTVVARAETERGISQARINAVLRLIDSGSTDDDPEQLRAAAAAGRDATAALAVNDRARALALVERAPAISHQPLRDALQRLAQAARGRDAGAERRTVLRAAVYPRRDQAERLARQLIAAGLPARLRTTPGAVEVLVGPYPARDPGAVAAVARIAGAAPTWLELP